MLNTLALVFMRDLKLYIRRSGEWATPLLFFVMITTLFPMALGSDLKSLDKLAPAIIWVAVLLSLVMSLESVFRTDIQEGSLEQFILSPYPLSILMFAKSMAHCIAMGLPLLILAPIFSLTLHLDAMGIFALWITLSLGIPTISLIGSIAAALTIGLQRGGLLLAIIILPLIMPIVIFGASGVRAASLGLPFYSEILFLAAFLLLALVLGPVAVAAAVRVSLD